MSHRSRISAGLLCVAALLCAGGGAHASSDAAWEAMRAKLRAKCLAAVGKTLSQPQVRIDPFGSESYALALVSGVPRGGAEQVSSVCVMAKRTGKVELGGQLQP